MQGVVKSKTMYRSDQLDLILFYVKMIKQRR